ncbi:unnamed protein product [Pylaiella littoralis]
MKTATADNAMFVKQRQSRNYHRLRTRRTMPLSNNAPDINTDTNTSRTSRCWWSRSSSFPPPSNSVADTSSSSSSSSGYQARWLPLMPVRSYSAAVTAWATLVLVSLFTADAQPHRFENGGTWKARMSRVDGVGSSWWGRWNSMIQPRIDELVAVLESDRERNHSWPFRVTMVGDSTMMHQHGVVCGFLGERPGRRFDPTQHQEECCIDTLPREVHNSEVTFDVHTDITFGNTTGTAEGGRGLCFRHHNVNYLDSSEWESFGSPDAVYFGCGMHLMHMARPGGGISGESVRGWLTYERDLENFVDTYRAEGGNGFRLVFMTTHSIQDSVYSGDFRELMQGYWDNNTEAISSCQDRVGTLAQGITGLQDGYNVDTYCRLGLMVRNGSNIVNARARPVMARLGVPLVEADLIVKDQEWATLPQDGRHYGMLVPVEVWELLGVLVSSFKAKPTPATE